MAQQLPLIESGPDTDTAGAPLPGRRAGCPGGGRAYGAPWTAAHERRASKAFAVASDHTRALVEIAPADWQLDQHTKEVGLAGVAAARRALARAVGRVSQPGDQRAAA